MKSPEHINKGREERDTDEVENLIMGLSGRKQSQGPRVAESKGQSKQ